MNYSLFFTILLAVVLISAIYRRRTISVNEINRSWGYKNRVLIALLAITIIPLYLLNSFLPERIPNTPEEKIYIGKKYENDGLYIQGLQELADSDTMNIRIQLEYINEFVRINDTQNGRHCSNLIYRYLKSELFHRRVSLAYAEFYCKGEEMNIAYMNNVEDTVPYINFMKAIYYMQNGRLNDMERVLLAEERVNPAFDLNYKMLYQLYEKSNEDSLKSLMENRSRSKYLPHIVQNDYHFLHGNVGLYFLNMFDKRLGNVGLFTFLAAFVVSFIWILFLRSMDLYNREKWRDIILVFLLGSVFTFLCLPIYDYARLILDWHITGQAFNDFMYCTIVIGGGEELVKFIPWILFGIFSKKLREPFDYILYASIVALGFAFVENLMYLEKYHNIVVRSIMSTVGHMFDASIVAYAFIVARFRMKRNSPWKWLVILAGFALAMLAHGFYDYWLISPAAEGLSMLTMLFFIASLRVWFYFKNNAMNHSPYYSGNHVFNVNYQRDLITIALISVLMLEYTLISFEVGALQAFTVFTGSALYVGIFVVYMSLQLDDFKVEKGVWRKLNISKKYRFKGFGKALERFNNYGYRDMEIESDEDCVGLQLRLFAPKSNRYIGDKLPVTGSCIRPVQVNGTTGWYIFRLNTPVSYSNYVSDYIIIRTKDANKSLREDKIEIYFMFMPSPLLLERSSVMMAELRYAGRAYSRPV